MTSPAPRGSRPSPVPGIAAAVVGVLAAIGVVLAIVTNDDDGAVATGGGPGVPGGTGGPAVAAPSRAGGQAVPAPGGSYAETTPPSGQQPRTKQELRRRIPAYPGSTATRRPIPGRLTNDSVEKVLAFYQRALPARGVAFSGGAIQTNDYGYRGTTLYLDLADHSFGGGLNVGELRGGKVLISVTIV